MTQDEQALRIAREVGYGHESQEEQQCVIDFARRLRAKWMAQQEPVLILRVEKAKNGRLRNWLDGEWQKTLPVGEYPLYAAPVAKPAAQDCVSVPRDVDTFAHMLIAAGWRSPNDAQWTNLAALLATHKEPS